MENDGKRVAAASRWPRDGAHLDLLDKWLSSPFFHLRLGKPLELLLSVPGTCFGMPAAGWPAALLLALLTGGDGGSRAAWPLTALVIGLFLALHLRLLLGWDELHPAATAKLASRTVYSVASVIGAPLAAVGTGLALELPGGGAAHAYLLVWHVAIGPILALKQAARRRRPASSDHGHHAHGALPHKVRGRPSFAAANSPAPRRLLCTRSSTCPPLLTLQFTPRNLTQMDQNRSTMGVQPGAQWLQAQSPGEEPLNGSPLLRRRCVRSIRSSRTTPTPPSPAETWPARSPSPIRLAAAPVCPMPG